MQMEIKQEEVMVAGVKIHAHLLFVNVLQVGLLIAVVAEKAGLSSHAESLECLHFLSAFCLIICHSFHCCFELPLSSPQNQRAGLHPLHL